MLLNIVYFNTNYLLILFIYYFYAVVAASFSEKVPLMGRNS